MGNSGQLTFTTMGGDTVTVKARGKHYVQQRGYAASPGTGPAGETCGSCQHIIRGRKYRKCALIRAKWTHGPGTDILARTAACSKWAPECPCLPAPCIYPKCTCSVVPPAHHSPTEK